MRVERVQVQGGHAATPRRLRDRLVVHQRALHARARVAFDPVASAGHDEQLVGVARALPRHIEREFLAVDAG